MGRSSRFFMVSSKASRELLGAAGTGAITAAAESITAEKSTGHRTKPVSARKGSHGNTPNLTAERRGGQGLLHFSSNQRQLQAHEPPWLGKGPKATPTQTPNYATRHQETSKSPQENSRNLTLPAPKTAPISGAKDRFWRCRTEGRGVEKNPDSPRFFKGGGDDAAKKPGQRQKPATSGERKGEKTRNQSKACSESRH